MEYETTRGWWSLSIEFDGDGDSIDLGTINSGDPLMLEGSDVTISLWFKQNAEHKWEMFLELGLEKRRKELAKKNKDKNVDCVILDVLI